MDSIQPIGQVGLGSNSLMNQQMLQQIIQSLGSGSNPANRTAAAQGQTPYSATGAVAQALSPVTNAVNSAAGKQLAANAQSGNSLLQGFLSSLGLGNSPTDNAANQAMANQAATSTNLMDSLFPAA